MSREEKKTKTKKTSSKSKALLRAQMILRRKKQTSHEENRPHVLSHHLVLRMQSVPRLNLARKTAKPKKRAKSRVSRSRKIEKLTENNHFRFAFSILFGAIVGVLFCGYCTFLAAEKDVEDWLAPNAQNKEVQYGTIWSDELKLWVGAPVSKEMISDYLLASGYALVDKIEVPYDFMEKKDLSGRQ